MPRSVQAGIAACQMDPGDVVMLNDPFCGGTHLPDITLISPVYMPPKRVPGNRGGARVRKRTHPDFYVASRAHRRDVGGAYAGSMGLCREIYQEGFRIPPVRLQRAGVMDRDVLQLLLAMCVRRKNAKVTCARNSQPATREPKGFQKFARAMELTAPSERPRSFWNIRKS